MRCDDLLCSLSISLRRGSVAFSHTPVILAQRCHFHDAGRSSSLFHCPIIHCWNVLAVGGVLCRAREQFLFSRLYCCRARQTISAAPLLILFLWRAVAFRYIPGPHKNREKRPLLQRGSVADRSSVGRRTIMHSQLIPSTAYGVRSTSPSLQSAAVRAV